MKNISLYIIMLLTASVLVFTGCDKDDHELGALIAPSNMLVTYEIVGGDDENPNGDGSGSVIFTTTADNAITYKYTFGDGFSEIAASGINTHRYSKNGLVTYDVMVQAVGTGGITTTTSLQVEVYSSFSDDEAIEFLTAGTTKSWYWAADQIGHLGLGPNDQVYENGEQLYAAWYNAAAWEKNESTLYDCEFVFSQDGDNVTFEQINPSGEAFIQGLYAAELGLGDEGSHPFDIDGVKTVSLSPSASIATVDGNYRGTTINYSDGGFMGFYAGSSQYEIIEITENILKVRMVQANEPLFAWYHTFTSVKPAK